ncbi:MAG: hypothetical protein R3E67_01520 [Pseudomonadales bacterium]
MAATAKVKARRYINMMLTMLLGTVAQVVLDICCLGRVARYFLVINHLFREIFPLARTEENGTMVCVPVRLVFYDAGCQLSLMVIFRATSMHDAIVILKAMVGTASSSQQPLSDIVSHADDG